jgi:hypothetical protein
MITKKINYKGFVITKDQISKRLFETSLSKNGIIIPRSDLLKYENLEPSIYNKKQSGLSIKNYKLLIDKYLIKEQL